MKKGIVWLIIILLVAGTGGYFAWVQANTPQIVQIARVKPQNIRSYFEERGKTSLKHKYVLSMPLNGYILPIQFEPGTKVKEGQIVAQVDDFDLQAQARAAQAEVERIQAELSINADNNIEMTLLDEAREMIQSMTLTAQAADEIIKANKAHTKFSEWLLQSTQKLKKSGSISDEKLRRAEMDNAQAKVDLATSKMTSKSVWAIKKVFDLGPKYVQQWLNRKKLQADVLNKQLLSARQNLNIANNNLTKAKIVSPVNGTVLARKYKNKRFLNSGTPLLAIGDMNNMQVECDFLSQEAAQMKAGNEVLILGQAIGDTPLQGRVIRVCPQAFTKLSSLGVEQQRVKVTIALNPGWQQKIDKNIKELGADYRIRARVFTAQADKALVVPRQALFKGQNENWQVIMRKNGQALVQDIKVGIINPEQAQVISGLQDGDEIVVSPPKDLQAGQLIAGK